jgi:twitching motility two-component system response regulator PilH
MARILIVDDSPTEIHVLKSILEKNSFEVLVANDGEAGIKMAKEQRPDLILMDVVMPGLNGFQATRKISKDPDTVNIPVILVTTKDQETDKLWGMRQGAKDYVVKPAEESDLIAKINTLLGG